MNLVTNLLNKLGIKVKEIDSNISTQEVKEKELSYEEAKNNHLLKYRGAFTGGANAEEEYNQHRVEKFKEMK